MRCLRRNTTLAAWCLPLLFSVAQSEAHSRYILDKVVVVARHGVRSPTDDRQYASLTGQQWPRWNVPAGNLTGHGYAGMVQQGHYWRQQWQRLGLVLPLTNSCPTSSVISLWAAPDQRTQATGDALLDGLFPGCGLTAEHSSANEDPLFDTVKMGIAHPNRERVLAQIHRRIDDNSPLSLHYRAAIGDFRKALCAPSSSSCTFLDAPWQLSITDNGQVKLSGPLSHAASMAESVRLAYSDNRPLSEVAFGNAPDAQAVAALMVLHAAKYDLVSDTPEYAKHGGSLLMTQIVNALSDAPGRYAPRLKKSIVIFVGHDTNIAQLQTMLGFDWQLAEYPRNDIPPGGSLEFLRFRDSQTGEAFIQLRFVARSLDQWRALTPLSTKNPMFAAQYGKAGCFSDEGKSLCPLPRFIARAKQEMVSDGATISLYR